MRLSIHKQLWLFLILTFPLSWYPWLIALSHGKTSGPNPLGPFVAALIVCAIGSGWGGVKDLLLRIVRWRVGIQWYAFAFLAPAVICSISAGIVLLSGAQMHSPENFQPTDLVENFIFIFLFIGLGEEPGWRGFGVQNLQKLYSPLTTSFIIWIVWTIWHLPLFGTEFTPSVLPAFIISVLAASIIQTWLYNRSNNSILLPMIFHAAVNTTASSFMFRFFQGSDQTLLWYIYAFVWLALSIVITVLRCSTMAKPARLEVVGKL